MKSSAIARARWAVIVFLVIALPSAFWRGSSTVFDVPKALVVWWAALALAVFFCFDGSRRDDLPSPLPRSFAVLLVLVGLVVLINDDRARSLFGDFQRSTGALTIGSGVLIALSIGRLTAGRVESLGSLILLACVPNLVYSIVQFAGVDPFEWESASTQYPVFGTFGNPNHAAGWMTVVLPLVVAPMMKKGVRGTGFAFFLGVSSSVLGTYDSFQGITGVVASAVLIPIVVWRRWATNWWSTLFLFVGPILVLLSYFRTDDWWWVPVWGSLLAGWQAMLHPLFGARSGEWSVSRWHFVSLGLLVVVGGMVLRQPLLDGLAGGFLERGDFYRAGRDALLERPLVGYGFDSFGTLFTSYRPASHAINLEWSRTTSVHSIPLGLALSGGLILLLVFLVVVALVLRSLRHRVGQPPESATEFGLSLLGSVITWLVVSVVTTEEVAFFTLFFVLAGIVIALERSGRRERPLEGKKVRLRLDPIIPRRRMTWALLSIPVALIIAVILAAPLRGGLASEAGRRAFVRQDFELAEAHYRTSVGAAPWVAIYQAQLAESLVALGRAGEALDRVVEAARLSGYRGDTAVRGARYATVNGRYELAVELLESVWSRDPYAPELTRDVVVTISEIRQRAGENLDPLLADRLSDLEEAIQDLE